MQTVRAVSALVLIGGAGTAATQDFKEAGIFSSGKTNQLSCVTEHVAMSTTYSYYS